MNLNLQIIIFYFDVLRGRETARIAICVAKIRVFAVYLTLFYKISQKVNIFISYIAQTFQFTVQNP